ncbi:hypothetical protein D3C73_1298280 [compost metagenome]
MASIIHQGSAGSSAASGITDVEVGTAYIRGKIICYIQLFEPPVKVEHIGLDASCDLQIPCNAGAAVHLQESVHIQLIPDRNLPFAVRGGRVADQHQGFVGGGIIADLRLIMGLIRESRPGRGEPDRILAAQDTQLPGYIQLICWG